MTKTTNYQLNQWAKTDRILMEDFNADNAKLDETLAVHAAALAGKAPMALLHDETLAEDAKEIVLDMGGESWGSYGIILLAYTPGPASDSSDILLYTGNINQNSTHTVIGTNVSGSTKNLAVFSGERPMTTLFFPGKSANMTLSSLCFHYGAMDVGQGGLYSGKLSIASERSFLRKGVNVKAYGLL